MIHMELGCVILVVLGLLAIVKGEIYIVSAEGEPVVSYIGGVEGFAPTAIEEADEFDITSESMASYSLHLKKQHDMFLESLFEAGTYKKLYSYRHLINGFAVHMSSK